MSDPFTPNPAAVRDALMSAAQGDITSHDLLGVQSLESIETYRSRRQAPAAGPTETDDPERQTALRARMEPAITKLFDRAEGGDRAAIRELRAMSDELLTTEEQTRLAIIEGVQEAFHK